MSQSFTNPDPPAPNTPDKGWTSRGSHQTSLQDSPEKGDLVAVLTLNANMADSDGPRLSVAMASRKFLEIAGFPASIALPCGLGLASRLSCRTCDLLEDVIGGVLDSGNPVVYPFLLTDMIDGERWTTRPWATITPLASHDEGGVVSIRIDTGAMSNAGMLGTQTEQDLSTGPQSAERERTLALQRSLHTLSAAYAAYTWETDRNGCFTFISSGVQRILGYLPSDMVGHTPTEFMPEEEAIRLRAVLAREPEKLDMPLDIEHSFLNRSGREVWIRVVMIPIHDPITGIRRGHHGLTIDITDRKEAEAALNATLTRHQALFEAARDAIVILDLETRTVLEVNHQAAALTGRTPEMLTGQNFSTIFADHDLDRLRETLARCAADASTVDDEISVKKTDGSTIPTALRATSVTIDGRSVVQLIIRTLEDRISYERQLRQERYAAQAANRSKTEFLANMSHELRTPLNAIIGFSEILEQEIFSPLTVKQKDYVKDILESGRHLLEIINSILDLSKIEVGKFELSEHVFDFAETAGKCLTLVRERAVSNGVALERDIRGNIPHLRADPVRFKQILLNLLSNAVKFTPQGGVVTLKASVDDDSGDLVVTVKDTGIGMTQEEIARAMQPFTQVHGDRNRSFEGTGLGLSLAQRLCEQHGAVLKIDSEPNVGTSACVRIPSERLVFIGNMPSSRGGAR